MTGHQTPPEKLEVLGTAGEAFDYVASLEHQIYKIDRHLAIGGQVFNAAARKEMEERSNNLHQTAQSCKHVLRLVFGHEVVNTRIKEKADALNEETE